LGERRSIAAIVRCASITPVEFVYGETSCERAIAQYLQNNPELLQSRSNRHGVMRALPIVSRPINRYGRMTN
jgi:hypothetical protein